MVVSTPRRSRRVHDRDPRDLRLDVPAFSACVDSTGAHEEFREHRGGRAAGITGTLSFLEEQGRPGVRLVDVQPLAPFEGRIKHLLPVSTTTRQGGGRGKRAA